MNARNLMLKTVGPNGEAFGGFKWPLKIGAVVHARDWNNTRGCGGGLHGFLHGRGDGYLANWNSDAKWIVAECLEAMVKLDGKVKCKSAIIRFIGTRKEATDFIMGHVGAYGVIGATLTGGDRAKLTGGYRATLTGGDHATLTGGNYATLTGGSYATLTGGDRATLTGGDRAKLTGGYRATLTGGDHATLTGGNYATLTGGSYATLTGGDRATLTGGRYAILTGGNYATLTGGSYATLTGGDRAILTGGNYATLTGGDRALLIGGEGSKFRAGIGSTFFDEYNKVLKMVDGVTIKAGVFYRYDTIWEECDV